MVARYRLSQDHFIPDRKIWKKHRDVITTCRQKDGSTISARKLLLELTPPGRRGGAERSRTVAAPRATWWLSEPYRQSLRSRTDVLRAERSPASGYNAATSRVI